MAYVHQSDAEPIDTELVRAIAQLIGLTIPEEDLGAAAEALTHHLVSARALDAVDLSDVDPAVTLDPRWSRDE